MKKQIAKLRSLRRRRGQGMTEYIIIVGLIAVMLIGAVEAFRDKLGDTFKKATNKIDSSVTSKIDGGGSASGSGTGSAFNAAGSAVGR